MKKLIFVYGVLLFFSCKKKTTDPTLGTISSFYVNGRAIPREGFDLIIKAVDESSRGCAEPHYAILIGHNAQNDSLNERINIYGLPYNKRGKIPLIFTFPSGSCDSIPTASFYMSGSGGDLIIASYVVLKKSDSFVNIDTYDTASKEIKGTFNITFVADGTSALTRAIYPDTIRFTDAKFTARINK